MKRTLLSTYGHFRPYLSAAIPNKMAPTERNMSTRVMPHVISAFVRLNSLARSVTVKETVWFFQVSHVLSTSSPFFLMFLLGPETYKEIEGVPGPANKAYEEEQPLLRI